MSLVDVCGQLAQGLSSLFTCSIDADYVRIHTPFLYPDGEVIDLFCLVEGDIVVISDLGETTRWLRMQTAAPKRSTKEKILIEDVCLTHGIEFHKGMLQALCRPGDSLAAGVLKVAQAALRVADLWFAFRTHSVESVTDEESAVQDASR